MAGRFLILRKVAYNATRAKALMQITYVGVITPHFRQAVTTLINYPEILTPYILLRISYPYFLLPLLLLPLPPPLFRQKFRMLRVSQWGPEGPGAPEMGAAPRNNGAGLWPARRTLPGNRLTMRCNIAPPECVLAAFDAENPWIVHARRV